MNVWWCDYACSMVVCKKYITPSFLLQCVCVTTGSLMGLVQFQTCELTGRGRQRPNMCGKYAWCSHFISKAGEGFMASHYSPVICSTNIYDLTCTEYNTFLVNQFLSPYIIKQFTSNCWKSTDLYHQVCLACNSWLEGKWDMVFNKPQPHSNHWSTSALSQKNTSYTHGFVALENQGLNVRIMNGKPPHLHTCLTLCLTVTDSKQMEWQKYHHRWL
jgi:hypothetical protein